MVRPMQAPSASADDTAEAPAPDALDPAAREPSGDPLPRDLGLFTVLRDDGSADEAVPHIMPDALLLRAYEEIKRLRLLDARMILLQRQGRIGFYGACTGQEATPIATALAIEPSDWVFPALRESVMMLMMRCRRPCLACRSMIIARSRSVIAIITLPRIMNCACSTVRTNWSRNWPTRVICWGWPPARAVLA